MTEPRYRTDDGARDWTAAPATGPTWSDDDLNPVLSPAEQAGLDALCAAVTAEIGDQCLWYGASDLAWILESALYQAGRLIRTGQPLTLPSLGTFERRSIVALGPAPAGAIIAFEPDPLLLETTL